MAIDDGHGLVLRRPERALRIFVTSRYFWDGGQTDMERRRGDQRHGGTSAMHRTMIPHFVGDTAASVAPRLGTLDPRWFTVRAPCGLLPTSDTRLQLGVTALPHCDSRRGVW